MIMNKQNIVKILSMEIVAALEIEKALKKMPKDKTGLVVGSGSNSSEWKMRGWSTLDIDPNAGADFTQDVNTMSEVETVSRDIDYVYAEHICFDPGGKRGAAWGGLLGQSNSLLKMGGVLAIDTANIEFDENSTIPGKEYFKKQLLRHGFSPLVVSGDYSDLEGRNGRVFEQHVVYYGIKIAVGTSDNHGTEAKSFADSHFFALIFWSWALGGSGIFMAVPLLIMVKVLAAQYDDTRWLAALISDGK